MKKKALHIIGASDYLDLPEFNLENVPCKIDSGAYSSTIHCSKIWLLEQGEQLYLCFKLNDKKFGISTRKTYKYRNFSTRKVRSSNGEMDERYAIKTTAILFGTKINIEFTLTSREKMKFPILLGRRVLRKRFLIDVSQKNLSYHLKNETAP